MVRVLGIRAAASCRQSDGHDCGAGPQAGLAHDGDLELAFKFIDAASSAGADAISAINTVGPGMVIDIRRKKPMLGNIVGGVSGPGIRPVAVRCVWDIYNSVKCPILGMGGVETANDVVEMMLAGATLVGVGSAWYRHGFGIYAKIKTDLIKYMKENKIKSLSELVGGAHG